MFIWFLIRLGKIKTVKDQVRRTLPTFLLAKFLAQFGEDVRQALFGERFHGEAVTLKETGHRFVCFEEIKSCQRRETETGSRGMLEV